MIPQTFPAKIILVAGLLLSITVGRAADDPAAASSIESRAAELKKLSLEDLLKVEVATVTTASKKAEKETDAPATVIVITAHDIQLRGYSTLTDVLRDLPGMETIPFFFSEFGTQVPVRGISGNNKIIVLVNGMRVNPPGGASMPFRSDLSVRDADQIEVIYGPGSTLYGQDAISAVINIKTKLPTDGVHGEVGADGGLNNEREAWGTFSQTFDKERNIRLSGYVQYHDSDLTRLDKEYPAWWQSYKILAQQRGSGVVPVREDFGVNVFARMDFFNSSIQVWHRDSERSSSEGGYPPAYVSQAVWEDRSTVVEGKNTLALGDKVKLDSSVTYSRYEIDPSTRYVFNTPNLTNAWFLDDYKYGISQGLIFEETVHADLHERFTLLAGFMAGIFDVIPKSTVPGGADPDGNVFHQAGSFVYIDSNGVTNSIPRVVRVAYETYAGYIEGGWHALDQLHLIAGVRVTKDTRFTDTPVTPRASVIYDVTDKFTAKYVFTRAYVAPAPYFGNATYDNGQLLATSNPNLKPEKAETHEVNLTYNRKNLSLGVSGYYGTQNDLLLVSDQNLAPNIIATNVTLLDGTTRELVHTVNAGDSRRFGTDVYGRAKFGPVSPWFSYSYVDFQQTTVGVTTGLPGISRHVAKAGATWAVTPKLFVTPSLAIRSTPENVPPGALKSELDTPYDINLYLLYTATKHLDFFADLRNITDNHYALGGFAQRGQAIPQETFSAVFGVRAKW